MLRFCGVVYGGLWIVVDWCVCLGKDLMCGWGFWRLFEYWGSRVWIDCLGGCL